MVSEKKNGPNDRRIHKTPFTDLNIMQWQFVD